MHDYGEAKKIVLLAALVSAAQGKARDDVAEMFCRRVATLTKRARAGLEALREAHRAGGDARHGRRPGPAGDHISDEVRVAGADGSGRPVTRVLDMSFASEDWRRAIRDRKHLGTFVRRHLEACVLTYLAEELRTGDIAVTGAQAYANWADQLLSPAEGAGFRADLQGRLSAQGADCDGGYPDNADLVIGDQGGRNPVP